MVCVQNCLLSFILIGGILSTMLTSKNSKNHVNLENLMNEEQKSKMKEIVKMRLKIFLFSLLIGVIVAFIITMMSGIKNETQRVCMFVTLALITNTVAYILWPKGDYMIYHLTSVEQKQAWFAIYNEMKMKKIIGMVLGVIAYYILGRGLLC